MRTRILFISVALLMSISILAQETDSPKKILLKLKCLIF